ncbi:MAG: chemotaxis protein CheD [Sedimentisphaerales bacterium]|nr:chemotaxis protein CheD [Sedimentisphaerales bacterium]
MKLIVDISDARISADPNDELITYSLGSCIGATLYDPVAKIGGMLHCQLPTARNDREKAKKRPFMFADTGMDLMLQRMIKLGAVRKRLNVKLAGGAQMMNDAKVFQIGKRNYAAIRQYLWKKGMFIDAEDVGGGAPRNMQLAIANGSVLIKTRGQSKNL